MSRPVVALALLVGVGVVSLLAAALGWSWYVDGPLLVVLGAVAGYAAGAWLPRRWAVVGAAALAGALVVANQFHNDEYHWLDDAVFFLVVVGGPSVAGATVTTRARQVRRLTQLQGELEELQRIEVAAARLDEQGRVVGEVHARLAEQIASIAIRAEGARRAADPTAFEVIEDEARSVLDRLREALGSLRAEDEHHPPEAVAGQVARPLTLHDVLLPAAVGAALAVETAVTSDARGPLWANAVAALVVVAPLVARRRHPVVAATLASAAGVAMSAVLTPLPETVTGVALLVVIFYSVGAWSRGRWWIAGWGTAALGTIGMSWVSGREGSGTGGGGEWIVLAMATGAVAVGRVAAGWQERVRRTKAVVEALEHSRGAAVRLAVAKERLALAAELHDTVAHAMTVVCLQAGAQQRTGSDGGGALQLIASVAEKSLAELRDGLEAMETAGDPLDRSRIAALGRRVGVDLDVTAEDTGAGPAAALAHRVIREAVVNIARHAPGASGAVRIRRTGSHLSVEVVDDGSRHSSVLTGTGTGLRGLAETLEAAGGTLEWGRREPSGFRVAALIPQGRR
ncbi:sensor histidine kinase [Nocardioides pakistanensis]